MKREMKLLNQRVLKVVLVTLIFMTGLVLWANAQEVYTANKKLEVLVYVDIEDYAVDSAVIMLCMKKRFVKGDTFGYAYEGDTTTQESDYWRKDKARISKRSPFGYFVHKDELKRMTTDKIEYVIVANDWYELTPAHQKEIMLWAKIYWNQYYEI